MAKDRQRGQQDPGMAAEVVTPDGLDPALDQKQGALKAPVSKKGILTLEQCQSW